MSERAKLAVKAPEAKRENSFPHRQKTNHSQPMSSPVNQILSLQRTIGNQAVQRLIKSGALQAKLKIGLPGDKYEQEADRVAEQVMRMPQPQSVSSNVPSIQRACPACEKDELRRGLINKEEELKTKENSGQTPQVTPEIENNVSSMHGGGQPLPGSVRAFYEPRFGRDFSQVRVHINSNSIQMNRDMNAHAFTHNQDIYFGAGNSPGKNTLTAHELMHVVQQTGCTRSGKAPQIQRVIEVRPPGRGEASAFDRCQELIDRLNHQSAAIQYTLVGRVIHYKVVNEAHLTNFDRKMRSFIDRTEVVPMRLITGAGYVQGGAAKGFEPLLHDSWIYGYIDLDDILASDNLAFQSQFVHILTERFATRNYERRIGTRTFTLAEFNPVHRAGYEAEAELFQDVIGDSTIRYFYSEERPNGTWVVAFRSNEGYRVFKVFRRAGQKVQGGEVWVLTKDGRRLTVDQLRAERGIAAPAPATP